MDECKPLVGGSLVGLTLTADPRFNGVGGGMAGAASPRGGAAARGGYGSARVGGQR